MASNEAWLDGRIDASTYDKKSAEIREQQEQIQRRVRGAEEAMLPSAFEAVNLVALTSRAADLFVDQGGAEQRKLLRPIMGEATGKGASCDPTGWDFDNW